MSRLATSFDSAVKPQPLSRQAGLEQCGLANHATTRQVDEIKTFSKNTNVVSKVTPNLNRVVLKQRQTNIYNEVHRRFDQMRPGESQ